MNSKIQELQNKLSLHMKEAVLFANKNTVRNEQGYAIIQKDDEWRNDDN